jgi:hypothetical protein
MASKTLCDLSTIAWIKRPFYVPYGAGWMVSCRTGMTKASFGHTIVRRTLWKFWRGVKSSFLQISGDSNNELLFNMLVPQLVVASIQIQIQIDLGNIRREWKGGREEVGS